MAELPHLATDRAIRHHSAMKRLKEMLKEEFRHHTVENYKQFFRLMIVFSAILVVYLIFMAGVTVITFPFIWIAERLGII